MNPFPSAAPPLPADALRESGHELIDRMADYLDGVAGRPVSTPRPASAIGSRFTRPLPLDGEPAEGVWQRVWDEVVDDSIHLAHPMYMGHQVAPPLPHAVLADALASLLNQSLAVWEMSPSGTFVEAETMRWLRELLGFPAGAEGTLLSGGSAATLTALLAAREARFPGSWARGDAGAAGVVLLVSPHAHYCVERAAGILGMGSDAVLHVAEREGRMDPAALDRALVEQREQGKTVLAVVATAGSTATGLFDPLDPIADVARSHGVWLHVDGAHGASFLLSHALRGRLSGIERADSVAWDPHKMMWMPISAGAVLVREGRHLDAAFRQSAPYLFHLREGEVRSRDSGQRTLQCSRRMDALKVWVCLQHYGTLFFGELLDRTVGNAERLHRRLREAPDFEPAHRPESNILCFRYLPDAVRGLPPETVDAFQSATRERLNGSGRAWITATVLEGRRVLRVTLMNPRTEDTHLEALLAAIRETAPPTPEG
jgi:L-2,4-diaminobutyrate decarboxylase